MKNDILRRNEELDERISGTDTNVEESIQALVSASRSNRKLLKSVIISIILETLIGATLIYVVIRTTSNSIRIQQTQNIITNNCIVGNEFRTTEKTFWEYILSIPSDQPMTPERQKQIDAFQQKLNETFAPRPCNDL